MKQENFWRKVKKGKANECWEWTAKVTHAGYGMFLSKRSDGSELQRAAHRVAYEIATGKKIPKGMIVMHSCDNPPCVNPKHLRVGTQSENIREMDRKGRRGMRPWHQILPGHKIEPDEWYHLHDMVKGRMLANLRGWRTILKIVQADRRHKNILAAVITGTGNGMKYRFRGSNIIKFKERWERGNYRLFP